MNFYGDWTDLPDQTYESGNIMESAGTGNSHGQNGESSADPPYGTGPFTAGECDLYVNMPIATASEGAEFGAAPDTNELWGMDYTMWPTSPGVDPIGVMPPNYDIYGLAVWRYFAVVDMHTDPLNDLRDSILADNPAALGLEWHPDDPRLGIPHQREVVITHYRNEEEGANVSRDIRLLTPSQEAPDQVDHDPETLTEVKAVDPIVYSPDTFVYDGTILSKTNQSASDYSPNGPTPYQLMNDKLVDSDPYSPLKHPTLGYATPADSERSTIVSSIPIDDSIFDAYAIPSAYLVRGERPNGIMLSFTPRALTTQSDSPDWPFRFGGNRRKRYSATATLHYRHAWTPPRYRLIYPDPIEPPPPREIAGAFRRDLRRFEPARSV